MTWLLALLSPRVLLGLGLAIAIAAVLWYVHRLGFNSGALSVEVVLQRERGEWAKERAKASDASLKMSEAYRAKETKDRERIAEVQANGTIVANAIAADSERTGRTNAGLRTALDVAAAALRSVSSSTPTAAADCAPALEAVRVRSDMLAGLAKRGAVVAGFAEESFNAAAACVSADAVTR